MKSDRTHDIPAALLVVCLLCNAACSKPKDSPPGPGAQPAPGTDRPAATADQKADESLGTVSPYDLQFIDTMSRHHRDAISMGEMAATKAQHAELKEFGGKLVTDQEQQVRLLKEWRDQWYPGKPNAETRSLAGMTKLMAGMNEAHMDSLSGEDFDRMFLDMMIPHHEGAIVMAKEAFHKVEHAELKSLSQQIMDVQQKEMDMMTQWKSMWNGSK